ncbi:MAG: hypothetical protein KAV82_15750 [Phycisphaerae bacterium]|nr:hypothetical protein [Phycisphaerae bacterium]
MNASRWKAVFPFDENGRLTTAVDLPIVGNLLMRELVKVADVTRDEAYHPVRTTDAMRCAAETIVSTSGAI